MDLPTFRKRAGLSQAQLAELLTAAGHPASQTLISQWESGAVVIPPERCAQLERVTSGGITRAQLRPDVFGDLYLQVAPTEQQFAGIDRMAGPGLTRAGG